MKLRDYQEEAVESVFKYYESGNRGNPIIVAATGAGKSVIIGALIKKIMTLYQEQRIIMITHVKELIAQNHEKLINFWPDAPAGIYSAGLERKDTDDAIICAGIQSAFRCPEAFGHRDLIFIDECHTLSPKDTGMYMSFIKALREINPKIKVIGFSATPWRLKGGSLLDQKPKIFTDIIYEIGIRELVDRKFLCPLVGKSSIVQADLSKVSKLAGEFNLSQAETVLSQDELTNRAFEEIYRLASNRKHFLFFCSGVEHSKRINDILISRGWNSHVITGETSKEYREKVLYDFKHATKRCALVNNAVLTTGIDLPNIDCIVLLRATASSVLYIQMLGRGMRLHPNKKDCLLLDFAGNVERFGAVDMIEVPRDKKGGGKGPLIPPQKICLECRESVHISVKECKCGYVFPESNNPKHDTAATTMAVSSKEIKPFESEVDRVVYARHIAKNGRPVLRVQYYDKVGYIASEYICYEHKGYPRRRAITWTIRRTERADCIIPETIEEAYNLAQKGYFKEPKKILTMKNGKYLEVVDCEL